MTTTFTSYRTPTVSVVVPTLNEEESIGWVMDNIPRWVSEVVLVDGLSVDGTELICRDRRDDVVIVHQPTRGKGAALRAGFAAASGAIVVTIDADGSTDPREIGRAIDALVAGAEFVKGSRNLAGGGSSDGSLRRRLGNLGVVHAANLLFGSELTDLSCGFCAFWAHDLERLNLTADGCEIEAELILSAITAGMTIVEVPSIEHPRRCGDSRVNARSDARRLLQTVLRQRFTRLTRRPSAAGAVTLIPTLKPAHDCGDWVPAGSDHPSRTHLGAGTQSRGASPRLMSVLIAARRDPVHHPRARAAGAIHTGPLTA